jgi:hypothetical protein
MRAHQRKIVAGAVLMPARKNQMMTSAEKIQAVDAIFGRWIGRPGVCSTNARLPSLTAS